LTAKSSVEAEANGNPTPTDASQSLGQPPPQMSKQAYMKRYVQCSEQMELAEQTVATGATKAIK